MSPDRQLEPAGPKTIARFRDLPEALLAQGTLESGGIESFLFDDNTVRMDWLWSNLLGGIKLVVHPDDVDAALELLNQPIPEAILLDDGTVYEQPRCPNCQSLDINFEELYAPVAYGSLMIFPLPLHRAGWTCRRCNHSWNDGSAGASRD